ncbi:MAG: transcription elongation factor GreA [Bacteroidota bacterium]
MAKNYYTQEGFEKAKSELEFLETTERQRIIQAMREARAQGDLSENAEYDAAKEAQAKLDSRIAELKMALGNAHIVSADNVNTSQISILSQVKVKNITNGATLTYTLTPPNEVDLKAGKISASSPIGKGLLGKKVGDKAKITVPAGEFTFEILEIKF